MNWDRWQIRFEGGPHDGEHDVMDDPRTYEAGPNAGWDGDIWIHELSFGKKLRYRHAGLVDGVLVFRLVPGWNLRLGRELYAAGEIDMEELELVIGWCLAAERAELAVESAA